jgi:hypothetical protein
VGHVVRIYGNVNGTHLTYSPAPPLGAPTTIDAGEAVELGLVHSDFEIRGDHEFAVGSFMPGGSMLDQTGKGEGDPSQSFFAAVEQYRTKYVFLAPSDYDFSYADVVSPPGATLTLDGSPVTDTPSPIGGSSFGVVRIKLDAGNDGAHVLVASQPVGLQVVGYGLYTSYQVPGGLNLALIAPPPVQ